jgi:hypothetical protein
MKKRGFGPFFIPRVLSNPKGCIEDQASIRMPRHTTQPA